MAIRVGWLPTGTQSAEDTRAATGALIAPTGLGLPRSGTFPVVSTTTAFALTSTGSLSCTVGAGQAMVCPASSTTQGGYPVTVDASGAGLPSLTFAAGGSLARTDVIYLQVQDTAEDGSGFTRGQVAIQQGTNGGGVPAVPSGALALWNVPIPASAVSINFSTASWVAATTVSIGGVVPASGSGSPAAAYVGQVRARYDRAGTLVPGPLEVWDGTNWNPAVPASMPRGMVAAPISSNLQGTATVGTTDTMDTVLSTLQVSLTAGRRYRVVLANLVCNGGVALDTYALRVRDSGSSSTPTTASPAVIDTVWEALAAGSSGRTPETLEDTFLATTTGTHTLAFFAQLKTGSGSLTPLSPVNDGGTGVRKLWIEDIGNV